jgi:UMP-CMP kinase
MLERLLKRGETSGREDDNIETIKKRFKTFLETSMPVVEHFKKQGKVKTVCICLIYS